MKRLGKCDTGKEYAQDVREAFERDTAKHEMTIVRDADVDGMHLRFKPKDSYMCGFGLTTWDDYLCFCGDMGTYVFQRMKPMFAFFRTGAPDDLRINPTYWAEKLQAVCKTDGYEEFSPELAKQIMTDELADREIVLSADAQEEFDAIFQCEEWDEVGMRRKLESFEASGKLVFHDVWEHNFKAYTLRYIWCCWAIVWGIRKYDEHMANKPKEGI